MPYKLLELSMDVKSLVCMCFNRTVTGKIEATCCIFSLYSLTVLGSLLFL
jgi:hypothetical protein